MGNCEMRNANCKLQIAKQDRSGPCTVPLRTELQWTSVELAIGNWQLAIRNYFSG